MTEKKLENTVKSNLCDSGIDIFCEVEDDEIGISSDPLPLSQMSFCQKKDYITSIKAEQPSEMYIPQKTQPYTPSS